jgi:hypothetical protein
MVPVLRFRRRRGSCERPILLLGDLRPVGEPSEQEGHLQHIEPGNDQKAAKELVPLKHPNHAADDSQCVNRE